MVALVTDSLLTLEIREFFGAKSTNNFLLRKLFLSPTYADSLVVLDDVWKGEVVKTFNLPCRILITTQV